MGAPDVRIYAPPAAALPGPGGFAAKFPKKASHRLFFRLFARLKKSCRNCDFDFFGRVPISLQTFKLTRELAAHFNTNRVIGIYMIYNIYKFQEK